MKQHKSRSYLVKTSGVFLLLLLAGGCASVGPGKCSPRAKEAGYACYGGINFGRVDDPLYRQGLRDGCRTGQGYFTKAYDLSRSSESYRQGWEKGRTYCRPVE